MKALLYRLDGKIKEFEVRGTIPYFILVEPDRTLNDDGTLGIAVGVVKGKERLFRLANEPFSSSVGYFVEDGVKPDYFKMREAEARQRGNYQYADEMKWMAERISRQEFLAPITTKIERYAEWPQVRLKPTEPPVKQLFKPVEPEKPIEIKPDQFAIKSFNSPKWEPPYQNTYVNDEANDQPFSNVVYTPKPTPPQEPEVIGEPKKRLILIQKEEIHEAVARPAAADASTGQDA